MQNTKETSNKRDDHPHHSLVPLCERNYVGENFITPLVNSFVWLWVKVIVISIEAEYMQQINSVNSRLSIHFLFIVHFSTYHTFYKSASFYQCLSRYDPSLRGLCHQILNLFAVLTCKMYFFSSNGFKVFYSFENFCIKK